jgi:tetratricopeptide (TPR) repeat protein
MVGNDPVSAADKPEGKRRIALSNLGTVLQNYGIMQWLDADPKCVSSLQEALDISELLEEHEGIESAAMHLGHAYVDFPKIRDLVKAEQYYQRKLDMATERRDPFSAGHALREIGQIYYFRFIEARQGQDELLEELGEQGLMERLNMLINTALNYATKAAELIPPTNPFNSHIYHLIGNIYDDAGQPEVAIQNYERSIQVADGCNDVGGASKGRREVARAYLKMGRFENALAYAEAALHNLEAGAGLDVAAGDMAAAQGLLATIRSEIAARQGGSGRVQ